MTAAGHPGGQNPMPQSLAQMRVALDVEIPSDVRYIERIVRLVTEQCQELDLPRHQCSLNVPVALTEAIANAILYGNQQNRNKHVRVRACVDRTALVLEIADEGSEFDLEECLIDPTSAENIEREDGRGLFLMRTLMDRVERYTDHGNVVRLTLNRL